MPKADSPQRDQKAQAERDLILRYKRLFARDDGKAVFEDLCEKFGFDRSLFADDLAADSELIARREAMRQPLYHIRRMRDHVFKKEPKLETAISEDTP